MNETYHQSSPRKLRLIATTSLWITLALLATTGARAQEAVEEPRQVITIRAIRATMKSVEAEIEQKRAELKSASTPAEKETLAGELGEMNLRLVNLRTEVESVATGIDVKTLQKKRDEVVDIGSELREVVRPIVNEMKKATSKPRELEELRATVTYYDRRNEIAKRALDNLETLISGTTDPVTKPYLEDLQKQWTDKATEFANELDVAQFQLEERLKSDESIFSAIGQAMTDFVSSRGKNFLLAICGAVGVFFVLRLLHRLITRTRPIKAHSGTFGVRLFHVIYYCATTVCAAFAGLVVLYIMGDWMLLGLAILFILGLAWAGKEALPKLFEQIKLMLNLGSVREGERVIYNGVPWRIQNIGVYSDLVNPWLTGGHLRLPLRDLIPLASRASTDKEPYFPCREGDWLILADGTYGKVVRQTAEWVQLIQLGSARKTYPMADFLGLHPRNLSQSGFRLAETFGIDYSHQEICTTEVPDIFREKLESELSQVAGGEVVNVNVEFAAAGASSLDYTIVADFSSKMADRYYRLQRAIARVCVDVCNERGWVIPFLQVTVHEANNAGEVEAEIAP